MLTNTDIAQFNLPEISQLDTSHLNVYGASVHNLKNIDVSIPRNKMVVITGISGSGKSSLAFDTIYAEGQRRYMESFSAYARQFIGNMERPEVEKVTGLSPVISIEQKTTNRNPRSTVGTITEIYDFMRLLFARVGEAYSYNTGKKMVRFTEEQILVDILTKYEDKKIAILAPLIKGRKGHYRDLFEQIRRQGFVRVRIDGEMQEVQPKMQVDRYKVHDIEVVIDRLRVSQASQARLSGSLGTSLKLGKGIVMLHDYETGETKMFSKLLMCPESGIAYDEPSPNAFSFNSPYGICQHCKGMGHINDADLALIMPDKSKSINEVGIIPFGEVRDNYTFKKLRVLAKKYQFTFATPLVDLPEEVMTILLYGSEEPLSVPVAFGKKQLYDMDYEGVVNTINRCYEDKDISERIRRWAESFMTRKICPVCNGQRLNKNSLHFKIAEKNISDLTQMDIAQLYAWFNNLQPKLNKRQKVIAKEVLKEIRARLSFLLNVGLGYLTLNRAARTLSGGESQRIRLATQIGSQLVGITYILDEPSIGLHQRDNQRLIKALKQLTDIGNTVLVVEHDKDIMLAADYVIDIGPGAGKHGGEIVGSGSPQTFMQQDTLTAQYLTNKKRIEIPKERQTGKGEKLILRGARGNNLKNVTLELPIGTLICITGVSGSGKSSLVNETLYPILNHHFYRAIKKPLPYDSIEGLEYFDKVIEIDQSPIGRTPRSNPATYIGVFNHIRSLYSKIPEAQIRGYKPGRFSFNVKGGRCEVCEGGGMKVVEMNFLPDVYVKCERCFGRRYNRETLEVRYRGKSISDVLAMSVSEAVVFFEHIPKIYRMVKTLEDVGLGYITLGQQATTLSGGEAQRVKLSSELRKRDTGRTCYILDEPTTGLHFEDIRLLLQVLYKLVKKGNTVIIIEHNMDVIKVADHVIDIGPEGGQGGGQIVCSGTPEIVAMHPNSYTGQFLRQELGI